METASSKDSSVASSSSISSSPNVRALLKIKILSWSQETGLPVTVRVRLGERTLRLHKNPLFSKSGYFKKRLMETSEVELPPDFPGGPETFETIALFAYGSSTSIDPFNVAALRCAAEFLEMNEEPNNNLCEWFDLYLNQVVLQNWDDTLIVLQRCQTLLPWCEELLIVSRCIESLAFMACMEILDPDRRREKPVVTLESLVGQPWRCETVNEIASLDLWIKDLIALPFVFFRRIIGSLRRQGMKEKYVTPIIVFYANKWIIDENANADIDVLQGVVDLLALKGKASRAVPVGFYFGLLSRSLEVGLGDDSKAKLQDQIVTLLHFSQVEDFLFPKKGSISSSNELAIMEKIFSGYEHHSSTVAELWDSYLSHIVSDRKMETKRFIELLETVPVSCRQSHDQLYRAMNTFLQAHRDISQDEKAAVCKYLNCQNLSQEACVEAVQNDMLPLRLIVQILFVQQLNTHHAFKECSDSFRYGDFSGSLTTSSRCPKSQNLTESPYTDGAETLNFYLQKERWDFSRKEYESTSFRIQSLEQELVSLKKTIQLQKGDKMESNKMETRSLSKKRNQVGQVAGCVNSVNFASQRKYARKLLKFFQRISSFGSRKSKRKTSVNM
ncbi:BTB/POZ domain-containing protein At5g48130 [Linum grandiflorum]